MKKNIKNIILLSISTVLFLGLGGLITANFIKEKLDEEEVNNNMNSLSSYNFEKEISPKRYIEESTLCLFKINEETSTKLIPHIFVGLKTPTGKILNGTTYSATLKNLDTEKSYSLQTANEEFKESIVVNEELFIANNYNYDYFALLDTSSIIDDSTNNWLVSFYMFNEDEMKSVEINLDSIDYVDFLDQDQGILIQDGLDEDGFIWTRFCLPYNNIYSSNITFSFYSITEDEYLVNDYIINCFYQTITADGISYYYDGANITTIKPDPLKYYWATYSMNTEELTGDFIANFTIDYKGIRKKFERDLTFYRGFYD